MAVGEYVGTTYQKIQQAVADYYGSGSDAWARIYAGAGGYYSPDAAQVIQQVPGVTVTYSNSGKVLGYSYANPYQAAGSAASAIDSNVQTGAYGTGSFTNSIPSTVVDNGQGQLVGQSGSRLASTGATVATVVDRFTLAAVGVALGTKLGKAIDSTIYSISPDWWDEHYPSINPETWDDMATTQGGRQFIQGVFGLQDDTTTMYMDERLLAQTYMMLLQQGAYSQGGATGEYDNTGRPSSQRVTTAVVQPIAIIGGDTHITLSQGNAVRDLYYTGADYIVLVQKANLNLSVLAFSRSTPIICYYRTALTDNYGQYYGGDSQTLCGTPYYYNKYAAGITSQIRDPGSYPVTHYTDNGYYDKDIATIIFDGNITQTPAMDGVSDDPRAQTYIDPSLITATTPEQVLQQLKDNYPDLFDGSIYQDTPQPDGTVDRINYIPVPIPDGITTPTPTTGETSQVNPSVNPNDNTDSLIGPLNQILTRPETQPVTDTPSGTPTDTSTTPATGDGNTPVVPPITGSASSLWKIYNPSQSEIDSFGSWLWSSNFIDQIKKLFNDPMQAIIGVHKVFCTPTIGGTTTIKCGYLDSEVSSNWVSDQYTHIDCGTVSLPEYFGNVFDYDPFTRVSLFIPCVGIVPLDVAEVMRSSINVKLHCDVLTGALLAEVNVVRDQAGGILYTYSGSCIVTYPVSSGTYVGAVANVVSVAASVAAGIMGTVASGGALAPAAVGATGAAVSGLAHTRTNVQHSGSFSGASGVMGGKIPYLIITRPQTRMAEQYPEYDGIPANFTSRLGDCTGYVKVKEVHLKVPNAYESEIAEIEQLLHQGVLI